jgi:hypothetical protein
MIKSLNWRRSCDAVPANCLGFAPQVYGQKNAAIDGMAAFFIHR